MTSLSRVRIPSILLLALAVALVFAATAAAETKVGEGTSPVNPSITNGEGDLLGATATYETTTGAATLTLTTREAPETQPLAERQSVEYIAELITANFTCSNAGYEAELKKEEAAGDMSSPVYPAFGFETANEPASPEAPGQAEWFYSAHEETPGSGPEASGPASKSLTGTTLSMAAATAAAANGPFNCVAAGTIGSSSEPDLIFFPLTAKPEPPAVVVPAAPAPTPAFSLTKIKPLKAKEGKWTKVNVKVTNTGNAAAGPIAIKAKAPKGVVLQPASGSLKLPALLAGQSWTVTFKVKLTAKAKKSSTIKLTTSSGAISAAGSFSIKLLG